MPGVYSIFIADAKTRKTAAKSVLIIEFDAGEDDQKMGLCFLRFEDEAVRKDMPLVKQKIAGDIAAFEEEHPQVKVTGKKSGKWP